MLKFAGFFMLKKHKALEILKIVLDSLLANATVS